MRKKFQVAARIVAALILFALMLGAFLALLVGGGYFVVVGPIWKGVLCLLVLAAWGFMAMRPDQFSNREDFGI